MLKLSVGQIRKREYQSNFEILVSGQIHLVYIVPVSFCVTCFVNDPRYLHEEG